MTNTVASGGGIANTLRAGTHLQVPVKFGLGMIPPVGIAGFGSSAGWAG
jgi:hypothetical protein